MNADGYRNWALCNGSKKKVVIDNISRLRRIEQELGNIDLDKEFEKDLCASLTLLFKKTGLNPDMEKYKTTLPIGKNTLASYKHALITYIKYKKEN